MKTFTVYALIDPFTSEVRYIGITTQSPQTRLIQLRCVAQQRHNLLFKWFKSLTRKDASPITKVLEKNPRDGLDGEKRWIAKYRGKGANLLNRSDGGKGPNGYRHTAKWKRNNSRVMKGLRRSAETCARISAAKIGIKRPDLGARNKKSAKISDEQVAEIRSLLADGESGTILAAEFGISPSLIYLIKANKRRS